MAFLKAFFSSLGNIEFLHRDMTVTEALIISIWREAGLSDVTASDSSTQQNKLMEQF